MPCVIGYRGSHTLDSLDRAVPCELAARGACAGLRRADPRRLRFDEPELPPVDPANLLECLTIDGQKCAAIPPMFCPI